MSRTPTTDDDPDSPAAIRARYAEQGAHNLAVHDMATGHDNPALAAAAALGGTHTAAARRVGETVRAWAAYRADDRDPGSSKVAEWGRRADLEITTRGGRWFAVDA